MALIEIDGLPFLKMGGFSMAMLNNQMVHFGKILCVADIVCIQYHTRMILSVFSCHSAVYHI